MNAIVLAGRRNEGRLSGVTHEEWEALIDIGGRPMLQYVVDALEGSRRIDTVFIVGSSNMAGSVTGQRLVFVQPGDSLVENLERGFDAVLGKLEREAFGGAEPLRNMVLVATSDIPLITSDMVDYLIDECSRVEADFFYPVVRREDCEARFPGVKRTYARLVDGTFTGGNLFILDIASARKVKATIELAVRYRKNVVKMASLLGAWFILRLLLGRLTVADCERKVASVYGIKGKAIICRYPEIGVDVDKPSDLELARRVLGQGR